MRAPWITLYLSLFCSGAAGAPMLVEHFEIGEDDVYLNLPVRQENELTKAGISVDGEVLDEFTLRLTDREADSWTLFDVSRHRGRHSPLKLSARKVTPAPEGRHGEAADIGMRWIPQT